MKKFWILTIGAFLLTVQCGKNEGNKSVLKADSKEQVDENEKEITYRYVATDGSSALVTFKEDEDAKSISIFSNKKRIEATEETPGTYKKDDITIRQFGDSIKITQGENIIELRKAKGQ